MNGRASSFPPGVFLREWLFCQSWPYFILTMISPCSLPVEDQQKMGLGLGPCSIQNSREVDGRASSFPSSSSYRMTSISELI
eukprot:11591706-Ditylum_brightwellii.AAC.1